MKKFDVYSLCASIIKFVFCDYEVKLRILKLFAFPYLSIILLFSCKYSSKDNVAGTDQNTISDSTFLNNKCIGALGDVKYSILAPDDFIKENGECWRLLDSISRITAQKFLLFQRYRIDTIPDGRGVFLRAMNLGRDSISGDRDTSREIGSYQSDQVGPHTHNFPNRILQYIPKDGSKGGDGGDFIGRASGEISSNTGNETRPKNISLYLYIRVN